jgi:hypothetical protein
MTIFSTLIHSSQYCGGMERTIIGVLSGVRDVLGLVVSTKTKAVLVSIDFSSAFDRISHIAVMTSYGLNEESIQLL